MFLLVASRLYAPLEGALQNLAAVISTKTNINRMNEILDQPIQTGTDRVTNKGYDIVFDHVGFAYNTGETVLKDVSFTAKQGEVTALVGPSGGGKTTVSRLAARFWDINKGKITVGGMDISKIEPETLLSLYSIVFQDVTLFNNTIMENIRIGRKDATDEEVIAAARLANCEEFAEKLPDGALPICPEHFGESALADHEKESCHVIAGAGTGLIDTGWDEEDRTGLQGKRLLLKHNQHFTCKNIINQEMLICIPIGRKISEKTPCRYILLIIKKLGLFWSLEQGKKPVPGIRTSLLPGQFSADGYNFSIVEKRRNVAERYFKKGIFFMLFHHPGHIPAHFFRGKYMAGFKLFQVIVIF